MRGVYKLSAPGHGVTSAKRGRSQSAHLNRLRPLFCILRDWCNSTRESAGLVSAAYLIVRAISAEVLQR
jgi:hypothetical protein